VPQQWSDVIHERRTGRAELRSDPRRDPDDASVAAPEHGSQAIRKIATMKLAQELVGQIVDVRSTRIFSYLLYELRGPIHIG
jgi:hypothetical protein